MSHALISTKYQVVIPRELRKIYGFKPGQRVTFIPRGTIINMVPERPFGSLRGIIKKQLDLSDLRDKSDRSV